MNSQKVPKVVEVPKWQYTGEHEWKESRRHVCDRNVRVEIVGWSGTNVQELWCRVWANVQLFCSRSRQALARDWKELWVCILVETWVPWPIELCDVSSGRVTGILLFFFLQHAWTGVVAQASGNFRTVLWSSCCLVSLYRFQSSACCAVHVAWVCFEGYKSQYFDKKSDASGVIRTSWKVHSGKTGAEDSEGAVEATGRSRRCWWVSAEQQLDAEAQGPENLHAGGSEVLGARGDPGRRGFQQKTVFAFSRRRRRREAFKKAPTKPWQNSKTWGRPRARERREAVNRTREGK